MQDFKSIGLVIGPSHYECENLICGVPASIEQVKKIELEGGEAVLPAACFEYQQKHDYSGKIIDILDQITNKVVNKSIKDNFVFPNDAIANLSIIIKKTAVLDSNTYNFKNVSVIDLLNKINHEIHGGRKIEITNSKVLSDGGSITFDNPYQLNRYIEKLIDNNGGEIKNYSASEISLLAQYSGYGGLGTFGDFSIEEQKRNVLHFEFYTPEPVVEKMWGLAYEYGFGTQKNQSVLEPSVGTGVFLKFAPKKEYIEGLEINPYSAKIAKILYPHANIQNIYFEQKFIKRNQSIKNKIQDLKKFGLVIGNPPYGKIGGYYANMGEKAYTKAQNYVEYFIDRGLDLVESGGLLIYIVGAEQFQGGKLFLDSSNNESKIRISEKSDLLVAYRLPRNIFERTGVSSEILVFRKK